MSLNQNPPNDTLKPVNKIASKEFCLRFVIGLSSIVDRKQGSL